MGAGFVDRLIRCLDHSLGDRGRKLAGDAYRSLIVITHRICITADLLVLQERIAERDVRLTEALGDT